METPCLKADLHVHSRYSTRPSEWLLRKIGCSESYTDPVHVYRAARARGMDLVTITDHNTLAGSLEIAHLDGAFVGEEVTTYFPEDGCKLHVLVYDITESEHEDISQARENVFDLVRYLHEREIVHVLAHPLYAVNDLLTERHFCRSLLLFKSFEMNGSRDEYQNRILAQILNMLTREEMEVLSERYRLEPFGKEPWRKNLVGGSDDHSSLHIARSFTVVEGASGVRDFLQGIGENRSRPAGSGATPKHLAQNLYSIAYQFYRHRLGLERYLGKDLLLRFIDRALVPSSRAEEGFIGRIREAMGSRRQAQKSGSLSSDLKGVILKEGREIILADPGMKELLRKCPVEAERPSGLEKIWFGFVNQVSEKVLRRFADSIMEAMAGADVFDIFHSLGSAGSLYTMLAPYFVSYTLFTKGRRFAHRCLSALPGLQARPESGGGEPESRQRLRVAHFTDTFHEVNGVATTLRLEAAIAMKHGKYQKIITCGEAMEDDGVVNFPPTGSFELPEYPELRFLYPPLLAMLDYCYEKDFTHIHSATPGPIGLAALAIARILKVPIYGTYHTALPQYVNILTGDRSLEEMIWKYTIWYYNQMDVIYVPSHATGREIEARGAVSEKIRYYPRGIDTERFHPSKRNGFFQRRFGIPTGETRLLYVGRVSREKNLPFLVEVFKRLCGRKQDLRLVVIGDGPYLPEMKGALEGFPVTFSGYLGGEDLAEAYASGDLFLFPSTTDTFGNVVLEAQASGLPVVVTDEGGPMENLIPGETGFVVHAGDTQAFVDTVMRMLERPELRQKMGARATEYMKSRTFDTAFLQLWESYRDEVTR
ncbi:MAG: glycosyltransferase [Deltaproteobacteria bacterium]|nr:glycosyltransferase [Deltaproteobacteria bacterium]